MQYVVEWMRMSRTVMWLSWKRSLTAVTLQARVTWIKKSSLHCATSWVWMLIFRCCWTYCSGHSITQGWWCMNAFLWNQMTVPANVIISLHDVDFITMLFSILFCNAPKQLWKLFCILKVLKYKICEAWGTWSRMWLSLLL